MRTLRNQNLATVLFKYALIILSLTCGLLANAQTLTIDKPNIDISIFQGTKRTVELELMSNADRSFYWYNNVMKTTPRIYGLPDAINFNGATQRYAGIAVEEGEAFLLNLISEQVEHYDLLTGELLNEFGVHHEPFEIEIINDTLFINDTANGKIQKYTVSGEPVGSIEMPIENAQIALTKRNNKILYTTIENKSSHKLYEMTTDGQITNEWEVDLGEGLITDLAYINDMLFLHYMHPYLEVSNYIVQTKIVNDIITPVKPPIETNATIEFFNINHIGTDFIFANWLNTSRPSFSFNDHIPDWVSTNVTTGRMDSGEKQTVSVTLDATELNSPGRYRSSIGFFSTNGDTVRLPIQLVVVDSSYNVLPEVADAKLFIPENTTARSSIYNLNAFDLNHDTLTYSFYSGNELGFFGIDTLGTISVADGIQLDYETNSGPFELLVKINDGRGFSFAEISVQIIDSPEAPQLNPLNFDVNEHSPVGTSIGFVQAFDEDGDALHYSLDTYSDIFSMDSSTGELTVFNQGLLDYEAQPIFTVTYSVTDGTFIVPGTAIINLIDDPTDNNFPPQADYQIKTIVENSPPGFIIGNLNASDPNNDPLTFEIISGNASAFFRVDEEGNVLVNEGADLNFEIYPDGFKLRILISDGSLSTEIPFDIYLSDVNEAPTVQHMEFIVTEHSPEGTLIGRLQAFDQENDLLEFTLHDHITLFNLDQLSGELFVRNAGMLDFETQEVFNLTATVSDRQHDVETGITVRLSDINDVTSIDQELIKLDIFPNPTSNFLNITSSERFNKVDIIDTSGKTVISLEPGTSAFRINLSQLQAGVHVVKLYSNSRWYIRRIVKK